VVVPYLPIMKKRIISINPARVARRAILRRIVIWQITATVSNGNIAHCGSAKTTATTRVPNSRLAKENCRSAFRLRSTFPNLACGVVLSMRG
jgi:hypothetical protein